MLHKFLLLFLLLARPVWIAGQDQGHGPGHGQDQNQGQGPDHSHGPSHGHGHGPETSHGYDHDHDHSPEDVVDSGHIHSSGQGPGQIESQTEGDVELDSEIDSSTTTAATTTTVKTIRTAVNPICSLPADSGTCPTFSSPTTTTNGHLRASPGSVARAGEGKGPIMQEPAQSPSQNQSQDQGQSKDESQRPLIADSKEGQKNRTRFYYSTTNYKCAEFPYSGCGGNENNFLTLESCRQECDKPTADVDKIKVARDSAHCWYKNKLYKDGDAIPETTLDNACSVGCLCGLGSGVKGEALKITCAAVDCPPPPETKEKCVPIYKNKTCCPSSYSCLDDLKNKNQVIPGKAGNSTEAAEVAKVFKCKYDGEEYLEGQHIYPKDYPCYTCLCNRNFTGILSTEICEEVNCGIAIHRQMELVNQCEPTYYKTDAGKDSCCPIDWTCAQSNPEATGEEEEE